MLRANFQVGASARVYVCKTYVQVSQGKVNSIKKKYSVQNRASERRIIYNGPKRLFMVCT